MSTIPKDEELKIYFENNFDIYGDSQGDVVQAFTFSEFKKAIKYFATDGREELEKQLQDSLLLYNNQTNTITALQSQCTEKDQEIERLKKENEYYLKDLKRLDGLYGNLK